MTPRQRDVFGWPPVGDPYWNAQTLDGVGLRYPGLDLSPYAEAAGVALAPQTRRMKIDAAKVIVTCPGRNFVTLKIETDAGRHRHRRRHAQRARAGGRRLSRRST